MKSIDGVQNKECEWAKFRRQLVSNERILKNRKEALLREIWEKHNPGVKFNKNLMMHFHASKDRTQTNVRRPNNPHSALTPKTVMKLHHHH